MAEKKAKKYEKWTPSKGFYRLQGVVVGIEKEDAYREGVSEKAKSLGKEWKSLRFGLKTSKNNTIYVELYGMEQDEAMYYNSQQDPKKVLVPWDNRYDAVENYGLIGTNISFKRDNKGKLVRQVKVSLDAVDEIREHVKDGDSIFVSGSIEFSSYTPKNSDEIRLQHRFPINGIGLLKNAIDFDDAKFAEVAGFEQDIVVRSYYEDKKTKKTTVNATIILKDKKFQDAEFVLDGNDNEKLYTNFQKLIKVGDMVRVMGLAINLAESDEIAELDDDPFGSVRPTGVGSATTNYVNELRITGIVIKEDENGKAKHVWEKKVYTEDDFVDEAEENYGDSGADSVDEDEDPFN